MLLYPLFHPAAALYTRAMLTTLQEDFARIPELLARRPRPGATRGAGRPGGRAAAPAARHGPSPPTSSSASSDARSAGRAPGPGRPAPSGAALAAMLEPGDLVFLRGELGAGKTTLVRAVGRGRLGVEGPVTSPTFTVAQRYEGRVPVAHVDAYRLGGPDDEEAELLRSALGDDAVGVRRVARRDRWRPCPAPRLEVELAAPGRGSAAGTVGRRRLRDAAPILAA